MQNMCYCVWPIIGALMQALKFWAAVVFCISHRAFNIGGHQRVKGEPYMHLMSQL
jgi:hypothetical protein